MTTLIESSSVISQLALNPSATSAAVVEIRKLLKLEEELEAFSTHAAKALLEILGNYHEVLPPFLEKLRDEATDVVLIDGLNTFETPEDCLVARAISLSLIGSYGSAFQYASQNGGQLVARLEPKPGLLHVKNTGEGSGNFGLHSDDSALPERFRVRHIQLMAVNNDAQAATTIARLDDFMPMVPEQLIDILIKPCFRTRLPRSFGLRHEVWSEPMPLVWERGGNWHASLPSYAAKPVDEDDSDAMLALNEFIAIAEAATQSIVLRPGMICIFHNSRILHGRAAFVGRRLVLRVLVRPDLDDLRQITGVSGNVFPVWPLLHEDQPSLWG
jgi:hypothetical protein